MRSHNKQYGSTHVRGLNQCKGTRFRIEGETGYKT